MRFQVESADGTAGLEADVAEVFLASATRNQDEISATSQIHPV